MYTYHGHRVPENSWICQIFDKFDRKSQTQYFSWLGLMKLAECVKCDGG